MACSLYSKKLRDFYANYAEESLLFETSQDYFNYLTQKLK
jgi:hypothetical protein